LGSPPELYRRHQHHHRNKQRPEFIVAAAAAATAVVSFFVHLLYRCPTKTSEDERSHKHSVTCTLASHSMKLSSIWLVALFLGGIDTIDARLTAAVSSKLLAEPVASPDVLINAGADNEDTSIISGNTWYSYFNFAVEGVPAQYNASFFMSHRSGQAPFFYTIGGFSAGELANVTLGFVE
jgi:hypothetical protein